MDLDGTVAVVTGAGAGLGRALSVGLADAGAAVVIADIDGSAAEETAALVRGRGVTAHAVPADVRDRPDGDRLVQVAVEAGGPHVLVNNAGGWTPGEQYPMAEPAAWMATLTLNLTAPMLLTQLVLEPMKRLGGGAIVNIASSAGMGDAGYGSPEYGAAKAGLIRFTSSLADLDTTPSRTGDLRGARLDRPGPRPRRTGGDVRDRTGGGTPAETRTNPEPRIVQTGRRESYAVTRRHSTDLPALTRTSVASRNGSGTTARPVQST